MYPMATAPDLDPKRRKGEEEVECSHSQQQHQLLLLDQGENKKEVNEKQTLLLQSQSPNWLQLPEDLTWSILRLISPSIPSILSFSAVCSSWRSLAISSKLSVSPPPLILSSCSVELNPRRSSMSRLKTLTPDLDPRTFHSSISKAALSRNCCGCSHGHLIFASNSDYPVLIADLFSSDEICLPKPPLGFTGVITHGVLTAPPSSSSSSSILFLISSDNLLLCWTLGGSANPSHNWSLYPLGSSDDNVESIVVLKGKLHILHSSRALFVLEFDPLLQWTRLPDAPSMKIRPDFFFFPIPPSYMRLADCDGELLLLRFKRKERYRTIFSRRAQRYMSNKIKVYRMDFDEHKWVKVRSIGDWCLFVDYIGNCPLACWSPAKWGGKSNHVYFAGPQLGPQFSCWSGLPLDGTEFEYGFEFIPTSSWPYPAWAYPTKLLMKFQQ